MFLKPPSSADKPKFNRSSKGAFTNRPLPKRKPLKPAEDEKNEEENSAKVSKETTPFVSWIMSNKCDCDPMFTDVRDYVLEGSPYKGSAKYGFKEQIKDAGSKWLPNPMKTGDCNDKNVKRGWWAAWDDKTLFYLLHFRDESNEPMWTCEGGRGPLAPSECLLLKRWMSEFLGQEETRRTESRVASILAQAAEPVDNTTDGASYHYQSCESASPVQGLSVEYKKWPGHTFCSQCEGEVWDQFLDCRCANAVWKKCSECWMMSRVDSEASMDARCGCS